MALVNMTEGKIPGHLLRYATPLVLSNLFQLTYNAVDSAVVGRYVGKEALASVGTSGPVMNLLVLFISGMCIGASVIMSEFFGAEDMKGVRREMMTTLLFGTAGAVLLSLLAQLLTHPLLALLQVPDNVMDTAASYLRVVLLGIPFTFVYNALAYTLKSLGDSRTPLWFLAISCVCNGILDIVLIGICRLGVVYSAVATVASQFLSCMLSVGYVIARVPELRPERKAWKPDAALLRRTVRYGGVTALQQACQPIGKLLIQGVVNSLGVDAMAVFNAVGRMDDYACLPEQSISHAISTFMAQNRGAKKYRRMKDGFLTGIRMEAIYGVLIGIVTFLLRAPIMRLFISGDQTEVIRMGMEYLLLMSFFYIFPGFTNGFQGYFRGMGEMSMTLWGTLTQISLRVLFVFLLVPGMGISGVALASALGWTGMLLLEVPVAWRQLKRIEA
ncbi:MAG: MATE family efflux transporter [Clostridia bacterium]|nr:MATE family efflux transporter [Clostridia bacterium]